MRTLWFMVSTLAIANLIALGGFAGWLGATGRLSRERFDSIRETFKLSVAAEEARALEEEHARQVEARALEEAAREGMPPLTAEHQLALADEMTEVAERRLDRMARAAQDLRGSISRERAELERLREEFEQQVEQFEEKRSRIVEQEGSEQFRKAIDLYRALKPSVAKTMLSSLVRDGRIDTVVAYLNALPTRTSSKIVAEFQKEDPDLAAELLEGVRHLGTEFQFAGVTNGEE